MRGGSDLAGTKEFDEWVRSITSKLGGTPQKKLRGRSRPTDFSCTAIVAASTGGLFNNSHGPFASMVSLYHTAFQNNLQ
jgi:hypothetical protein